MTVRFRLSALSLVPLFLVSLFAGCLAEPPLLSEEDPASPDAPAPAEPVETGTLRVVALAPDQTRVAEAHVAVGNHSAVTDPDGIATLDRLPIGNHTVVVSKDGWRSARIGVEVTSGSVVDVQAKLLPGSTADATVPKNETFSRAYEFTGVFECSLTYLIITGDCLLIADFVVNDTAGLPHRPGDATEDQNAFPFPLDLGWESVVVEMVWDAPLAPMGEKMQLALEPTETTVEGHSPKYARTTGGSPLDFTLHRDVPHETASVSPEGEAPDLPNPQGGEVVMARAYVLGEFHNPGDTPFLGIGAAYGQKFDIYATVFYGAPAPDGFSAIP